MAKKPTGRPKWSPAPPAPQNPARGLTGRPRPPRRRDPSGSQEAPPRSPPPRRAGTHPYQQLLNKLKVSRPGARRVRRPLHPVQQLRPEHPRPKILDFLQAGFRLRHDHHASPADSGFTKRGFRGHDGRLKLGLRFSPRRSTFHRGQLPPAAPGGGLDPAFMSQKQYAEWISKDISRPRSSPG